MKPASYISTVCDGMPIDRGPVFALQALISLLYRLDIKSAPELMNKFREVGFVEWKPDNKYWRKKQ